MLEGLILGVFLMTADQAAAPAPLATDPTASAAVSTEAPAPEATPTPTPTPAPAATTNANSDHVVRCRRGPAEVGSIMGHRICTTRAQDRVRAQHDQDEINRAQQNSTQNAARTSGIN